METNSVMPAITAGPLPLKPIKPEVPITTAANEPKTDQFVQTAKEQNEKSDIKNTFNTISEKAKSISPQDKALVLKSLSLGAMVTLADKIFKVKTKKAIGVGVFVAAASLISGKFLAPIMKNFIANKQETQKPQ